MFYSVAHLTEHLASYPPDSLVGQEIVLASQTGVVCTYIGKWVKQPITNTPRLLACKLYYFQRPYIGHDSLHSPVPAYRYTTAFTLPAWSVAVLATA